MRPVEAEPDSPRRLRRVASVSPILKWLPRYKHTWLQQDFLAGLTLAAYAIPVSLAYAALAGLPPQMGLYCYLVGGLGYALIGSSRHLAIGPTSALPLLLGVSLIEISGGDTQQQAALASLTALLMAGVYCLAWLLRTGLASPRRTVPVVVAGSVPGDQQTSLNRFLREAFILTVYSDTECHCSY